MLTVEIKVNGSIVKHIYAHNLNGYAISEYEVVVADVVPFNGNPIGTKQFNIVHERIEGIGKLISSILDVAEND